MGEEYDYENMIDLEAKHAVELRDREIQEEHERNLATERMYSQMGDYSWQTGCPRCGADRAGPCGAKAAERTKFGQEDFAKLSAFICECES